MWRSDVQHFCVHFQAGSILFLVYVVQPVPSIYASGGNRKHSHLSQSMSHVQPKSSVLYNQGIDFWPQSKPIKSI